MADSICMRQRLIILFSIGVLFLPQRYSDTHDLQPDCQSSLSKASSRRMISVWR